MKNTILTIIDDNTSDTKDHNNVKLLKECLETDTKYILDTKSILTLVDYKIYLYTLLNMTQVIISLKEFTNNEYNYSFIINTIKFHYPQYHIIGSEINGVINIKI